MNKFRNEALKFIRESFSDYDFRFQTEDPISNRMEFSKYIMDQDLRYYMYDPDIPRIILIGLEENFKKCLKSKEDIIQVLSSEAYIWGQNISDSLPSIIAPFAQELFPWKEKYFTVNFTDLSPFTDDKNWLDRLDNAFNYSWTTGDYSNFDNIFWEALEPLEKTYPGIILMMLKSCFVSQMLNFNDTTDEDDDSISFETDEYYEVFGESLGLTDSWIQEFVSENELN